MKLRRWISNVFLLTGVLALLISVGSLATAFVWQDWENWVFERDSRDQPTTIAGYVADKRDQIIETVRVWRGLSSAPAGVHPVIVPRPTRPPVIEKDGILGRLSIERLNLSAMVHEGDGARTLSLALGHIPGTALPGQAGNVGVAGHRDTLFRGLRNVHKDDLILFETLGGTYQYKVASIEIVKPQDVSVLNAGQHPELTLVTCYPFYYVGSAPDRFIVKARQVVAEPVEQRLSESPGQLAPPALAQPAPASPAKVVPVAAHLETASSNGREHSERRSATRKVNFSIGVDHSRQLAPGISLGVTGTDAVDRSIDGWMWLMPDRHTIWLRNQRINDPLVFYDHRDGRKRELLITNVTKSSVTGYLVLPDE